MKSKNLIILIFCFVLCVLSAQTVTDKKVVWNYPVKPGMNEWKTLKSNKEKVDACQIPEKVLFSLSTEDLTDLCMQYPLLYDVFAFENMNNGLDKLFDDFNGIRELYTRKDALKKLAERYVQKTQNFSFLDSNISDLEKGRFIISISAIEVLLSRIEGTDNESKETLQNLVVGYEGKIRYADYFKGSGFRTNVYSRIHVIAKMNMQNLEQLPQKNKNPALFSGMADEQSIIVIDELSYQLTK